MVRKTALSPTAMTLDDLLELRAVHHVAATRSFGAAARALGVNVSTVTRAVQRVEKRLGLHLFLRSTHGLSPTEAGRVYATHLARWLTEEDEVRDGLSAAKDARRGTLRITVPVFVAERVLPPVVLRFAQEHPGVRLDVHASDDLRDVVTDAFDLAIRMGPLRDSTLRARRLINFQRVVCAAPAFIERHGTLRDPAALRRLPCLLYGNGTQRVTWTFRNQRGVRRRVEVEGPMRTNNLELLVALTEAGLGITRLPTWAARPSLAEGTLRPVLASWTHERPRDGPTLWAVHALDPGKDRLRHDFITTLLQTIGEA
jgi:DNA-binding transcriptional LysR family regulator